jgi:hypothetical protein
LREKEGTRREVVGRMRVIFLEGAVRLQKEGPHPTLSRKRERARRQG